MEKTCQEKAGRGMRWPEGGGGEGRGKMEQRDRTKRSEGQRQGAEGAAEGDKGETIE